MSTDPVLAILLASAVLILSFLPLENTSWADDIRARPAAELAQDPFIAERNTLFVAHVVRVIDGLLRVTLFMGVPGWITWRIVRQAARRPRSTLRKNSNADAF